MTKQPAKVDDHAWEKEHAPKIGKRRLIVAISVYAVWVGFLVAGPLTVAGFMILMGERRPVPVSGRWPLLRAAARF